MHHRHHHHGRGWGGRGSRMFFRGGFPSRPEMIERLENFQRDLEQQLADVADVLAHLRDSADEAPPQQI
jgi:hypothetical protein